MPALSAAVLAPVMAPALAVVAPSASIVPSFAAAEHEDVDVAIVTPARNGFAPVTVAAPAPVTDMAGWLSGLERDARKLLQAGEPMVWDTMTRKFEAQLIHTALQITRGRRIEAAQKLGIGRNTITRKIQELGLDD